MKLFTALLTGIAMSAFAANSLLCRAALGQNAIDPASFTAVRVVCAALALMALIIVRRQGRPTANLVSVGSLTAYLVSFSLAYVTLPAGSGALVLFGAVQAVMLTAALAGGERLNVTAWCGFGLAGAGLVYLLFPGLEAPDPFGAALMAVAGAAWGVYSLNGRKAANPVSANAGAFLLATPVVLLFSLTQLQDAHITWPGFALAAASGVVASACGYVIWYAALKDLGAGRAAVVQLSVPAITSFGGVFLLSEPLSFRLLAASAAIIGGIAVVVTQTGTSAPATEKTAPGRHT